MSRRILKGKVVSCKNDKTIVVEVVRKVQHKLYKKIIKRNKRFHAHDDKNNCTVGQNVTIQETKPISKLKKWIVLSSLESEKQQ